MKKENFGQHTCMACDGDSFSEFLQTEDYFLSHELFTLLKCDNCGLLCTLPCPNPETIGSYYNSSEYTSHNSQQRSLKNILYRRARKIALGRKLAMIEKHVKTGKILDIGAGTGDFLAFCKAKGWNVAGIEPNSFARELAKINHGLELAVNDTVLEKDGVFNVISLWHVLEHLHDPLEKLFYYSGLLKPNGILVLALPNYESWDANHYGKYWAAYDVPRHLFHFSKASVEKLSAKAGFGIAEIRPLKLDAYYISLLSEKYANGKMNYFSAFLNGLRSNRFAGKGVFGYSSWVYVLKKI